MASGKTHSLLGLVFQPQQQGHQHQQKSGQLRGGDAVVHCQPGLVDARSEGLDAEITGHPKIGQGFHQGQRHASCHGRACHRQGDPHQAPPQRCAQQACGFHQVRGALGERRAGQQVNVGVQHKNKHQNGAAQAAHFGQHPALPTESVAQPGLRRPAELQKIGVGVSHHISRHGQWQQQRPFKKPPAGKLKQSHRARHADPQHRHTDPHRQAQQHRGHHVPGQHGLGHFTQNLVGICRMAGQLARRQPRRQHRQHRQQQDDGQQRHQDVRKSAKGHGQTGDFWGD